jgi:hypothetical protein
MRPTGQFAPVVNNAGKEKMSKTVAGIDRMRLFHQQQEVSATGKTNMT